MSVDDDQADEQDHHGGPVVLAPISSLRPMEGRQIVCEWQVPPLSLERMERIVPMQFQPAGDVEPMFSVRQANQYAEAQWQLMGMLAGRIDMVGGWCNELHQGLRHFCSQAQDGFSQVCD